MVTFPMTLTDLLPGFRGHGIFEVESQIPYVLRTEFLYNTNKKPLSIYRMVPLSMTFSDLWPGFQDHDIFWRRISEKRRVL